MSRNTELQKQWALVGAETRLRQLLDEMEEIYRAFPELRGQRGPKARKAVAAGTARRTRKLPRDFKRSVSEGMRKYWARRKAGNAGAKQRT